MIEIGKEKYVLDKIGKKDKFGYGLGDTQMKRVNLIAAHKKTETDSIPVLLGHDSKGDLIEVRGLWD